MSWIITNQLKKGENRKMLRCRNRYCYCWLILSTLVDLEITFPTPQDLPKSCYNPLMESRLPDNCASFLQ